ncbi:MAG: hypothetical protein IPP10_03890 [Candidatus Competibacteraceae bacterium]|nr:hypothetical protein [Candidatus Competibacteraceae bacterium]
MRRCSVVALGLTLLASGLSAVAAESEPQAVAPEAAVELFAPAPATGPQAARAGRARVGREAVRLNRAIADLPLQAKARFSLPRGVSYELVYDNRQDHPSGNVTWSGYLKDYGDDYRAVITFGEHGASGRVLTPDGEFLIESDAAGEWLIDTQASGLTPVEPGENDALIPLPEHLKKRIPRNKPGAGVEGGRDAQAVPMAADTTSATIDVMILYTPGLASRLGSGLSARLDQLVALSNQAYRDSGVYINLRLVHKEQVNYSDTTTNDAALNALTNGSDPALAGVANLRTSKGADLVSLIRPFNNTTSGGSCGVAWVGGYGGQPISGYANYGYSVIGDGRDVNGSGYYCLDLSFVHELGHNMGSLHDRANSGSGIGAYPYSYGYGVSGTFGTVMSYINPRIGKFSNPAITCAGGIACGISETAANSANNTLSLNNTRAAVAAFRSAQVVTPPAPTTYALTVSKSGSGTVSSSPAGINCGSDCSENYAGGTNVTLNAVPAAGSTFAGWSGACTGTAACAVTMNAAKNVTATFKAQTTSAKYTLTVTKAGSGAGTVVSNPAGVNCGSACSYGFASGTNVTLTATPASGSTFAGWSGACTGTGTCTVPMSAAKSVKATFNKTQTKSNTYTFKVVLSGSGTVTSSPAGINCGAVCSAVFPMGTTVTLKAVPATGYTFGGSNTNCVNNVCTANINFKKR